MPRLKPETHYPNTCEGERVHRNCRAGVVESYREHPQRDNQRTVQHDQPKERTAVRPCPCSIRFETQAQSP